MSKTIAVLPLLLLLVPGFYYATELTARNPGLYSQLWLVLFGAIALNVWMMIKHKNRENQH